MSSRLLASTSLSAPPRSISSTGNYVMVSLGQSQHDVDSHMAVDGGSVSASHQHQHKPLEQNRGYPAFVGVTPMRKISIDTDGPCTSPLVAASTRGTMHTTTHGSVSESAGAAGAPVRTAGNGREGQVRQRMRASPLVWSVPEDPIDPISSFRDVGAVGIAAAVPAPRVRTPADHACVRSGDGVSSLGGGDGADTPLNYSLSELPRDEGAAGPRPSVHVHDLDTPVPLRPPLAPSSSSQAAQENTLTGPSPCAARPLPTLPGHADMWRVGVLGPLWTVLPNPTDVLASLESSPIAGLERLSLENEVHALRRHVREAEAETESVRLACRVSAESTVEDLLRTRREEERRRRQQFQDTLDTLKEENKEIVAALEAQRRAAAMGVTVSASAGGGAASPTCASGAILVSATLEAEWARRLDEVEGYWRERLRTAERHWAEEMDSQIGALKREQHACRDAQRAAKEVQERLRHVEAEHAHLTSQIEQRLGMPLSSLLQQNLPQRLEWPSGSAAEPETVEWETVPQLVQEVQALRVAAVDHEHREEALLAQLDGYSEEAVRLQVTLERETQKLRRELEAERGRNAELVQLYGSQVQALHAQLKDALREKKELVEALRNLR